MSLLTVLAVPGDAAAFLNPLIDDYTGLVFSLPAGRLQVAQALAIPAGKENFTLDGGGAEIVPAAGYTGKLLTVGRIAIDIAAGSSELVGVTNSNVAQPTKGATTLTSTSGTPTTGYHWLAGDTQMAATGYYPEGEWVQIVAVNGTTLTLAEPILRTYRGAA